MRKSTLKNDSNEECQLCLEIKPNHQFMELSKCNHRFCRPCLKRIVSFNVSSVARCPYRECDLLLEEADKQNILFPKNVTSSIQRSTPITKQFCSFFKKKEKVSPEIVKDINYSSCEIDLGVDISSDSLNSYRKLPNLKSEKAENFSKYPETVSKSTINSRPQQYSNVLDEHVPNYLKNEESFDDLKRRTSKDEVNYSERQQLSESGNLRAEHVADTVESHVLIDLENLNAQSFNPGHHMGLSYNAEQTKQQNKWNAESRIQLQRHIKEKYHKVIDFMFLAIEADILLNTHPVECLMCREQLSIYEGISFPYCSYSFCRICLTNSGRACQIKCSKEIVILYSNSSFLNKNCAIILNEEIRHLFIDSQKFQKFQKKFVLNKTTLKSGVDDSSKSNDCNKTYQGTDAVNIPEIYFDKNSKEITDGGSNLLKTWSDAVLLRNLKPTECLMCLKSIREAKGVILRDCFHVFCDRCLIDTIMKTIDSCVEVRCPLLLDDKRWCQTVIQEREIKNLLAPEQYEKYERKCLETAQQGFESSARCFKPNCKGWIVFEGYKESFICPICGNENCLSCKAIHQGKSCSGYMMQQEKTFSKNPELAQLCPKCKKTTSSPVIYNSIKCSHCNHVSNPPKSKSRK